MMKNKKAVLLLLVFGFCLAGVNALWVISASSSGIYEISSTAPINGYTTHFAGAALDSTDGEVNFTDTATVSGFDGITEYLVGIDILKTDVEDSCDNYLDDCAITFQAQAVGGSTWINISHGESFVFLEGDLDIRATLFCEQYSCPQTLETTVDLTPLA